MPEIHQIKADLKERLDELVADGVKFNDWLDSLFNDDFGQVLGINLHIDLEHGSLDQSLVVQVIDQMEALSGDARDRFCSCLEDEEYQSHYICKHRGDAQPLKGDRYVRILPLDTMIEYYFRYALTLPSSSSFEYQDEVLRKFFNPKRSERKGLGVIERTWRGRMHNVWVTSKKQLDSVRSSTEEGEFANTVRDRLGFDEPCEGRKLVGIIYPVDFERLKTYIPTTLDAHAGCHFFIPFASIESDWGLSCCLNSTAPGFKERVHKSFQGLTDEFESEIIGDVTRETIPDWQYLLNEALSRA